MVVKSWLIYSKRKMIDEKGMVVRRSQFGAEGQKLLWFY